VISILARKNITVSSNDEALLEEDLPSFYKGDELILKLSSILDLDFIEARIYLNLLRLGQITASSLAKKLDIDRARTYRTIDKLISQSMVSTTFSNPKLCIAIKPEDALNMVLQKKQDEIKNIKKAGSELIKKINEVLPTVKENDSPIFRVAQGRQNIYSHVEKLIDEAKGTIFIVSTLKDISRMYHTGIPEKIKFAKKRGCEIRLLTELDNYELVQFVKRFNATETKLGKLPSQGRIIVSKDQQMIMSDATKTAENSSPEADFALWTNSPEMVNNIFSLCTFLWKGSKPLAWVLKTLSDKK